MQLSIIYLAQKHASGYQTIAELSIHLLYLVLQTSITEPHHQLLSSPIFQNKTKH